MEDTLEGGASKMSSSPISPVQIIKKAERQMRRERMVSAGKEYAPTLYTVLVNPDDDERLFGFYPTLAGEAETALAASATNEGLVMDGQPLVRFIVDDTLRHGKFDVVAEVVSAPIVEQLRAEENAHYGIGKRPSAQPRQAQQPHPMPQELPYVPEDEIDRSIDYGEYTFDSEDFVHPQDQAASEAPQQAGNAAASAPAAEPEVVVIGPRDNGQPQAAQAAPAQARASQQPRNADQAAALAALGQTDEEPTPEVAHATSRPLGIPSIYDNDEADDAALRAASQPFGRRVNSQPFAGQQAQGQAVAAGTPNSQPFANQQAGQAYAGQQSGTPSGGFQNNAAAQAAYASAGQVFDGNAASPQAGQRSSQPFAGQQSSQPFANQQAGQPYSGQAVSQPLADRQAQVAAAAAPNSQPFANQPYANRQAQAGYVSPQPVMNQQAYAANQQPYQQASSAEAYPREPQGNDFGQPVSDVFGNRPARNQVPYVVPTVMDAPTAATPGTVAFAGGPQGQNVPQRAAVRARLTSTMTNRAYDLATTRVLIGRETNNDIVVNDLNASRQHAEIHYEPQGVWVITDLGSTNGTLVNGQMVQRRGLQEGDRITIGITDFIFSLR